MQKLSEETHARNPRGGSGVQMKPKYPSWEKGYRKVYMLAYKAEHADVIRAKAKVFYAANREAIRAKYKARYPQIAEAAKARAKAWLKENPERASATKSKYRAENRELLNAKQLARYYSNHHQAKKLAAIHRQATRDEHRQWSRNRSRETTDGYVREMLSKYSTISARDWPQELVEAKRLEIMCMRLTGDRRYKALPATTEKQPKP